MKHLIILGDGMSDHPIESLGGKTLLEAASTPAMDLLAAMGRSGLLVTVPSGFAPGSEVANTSILGYNLEKVYEGRGPLEAASIGYEMSPDDLALRCNLLTLADDGTIANHHGGHLSTAQGTELIKMLDERLGSDRVKFIPGVQYRHLLVIKGGDKRIVTAPPHDHPGEPWRDLLVTPEAEDLPAENGRLSPRETADLINSLIQSSRQLLADHPLNLSRRAEGRPEANSIWPWSQGYRPSMDTLMEMYPSVRAGSVITAVDLIRGIGHYAGLKSIEVEGATGLADTNYEGKTQAALKALREGDDFVFLHIEATDEAGHDGDIDLKLKAIEYLDRRVVAPILREVSQWDEPVAIALLPDHATPVMERVHRAEPVPFSIWYPGITPDDVTTYSEASCARGAYGLLEGNGFMEIFMSVS
ncbi:MAG: cofactor-independent phosphoglycerate mutase [Bacteroides sp.]|nr:cofactor-independent phosphoglycerate mutase [Bacteroides sp.]